MKIKIKLSKILIACIFIIFTIAVCIPCFGNSSYSKNYTKNEGNYYGNIYLNACSKSNIYYDIKERGEGSCGVEERYQQLNSETVQPYNASVLNRRTCNSITDSHGTGREDGYADNFLSTGCCNYMGYSYTYGTTDIPFYIDESTMTEARAEDIRAQVSLWNEIEMHDGTGKIVNLYEVYHTNDINGRPVVIVSQKFLDDAAGLFWPYENAPAIEIDPNMNVDTPLHEFGHLLGLNDIDVQLGKENYGTHKVLMGYSRGTTQDTLDKAMHYQDIQGVAVMNNRHTNHRFDRYILNGDNYVHFCFYCDMVSVLSSALSESAAMINSANCDHEYQVMVSAGERFWFKCTRCYKVVENEIITTESGDEVEIESVSGSFSEKITIPSTINGKTVVSIGEGAFANQAGITQVILPETALTIGDDAFINCSNLQYVEGLGVGSIGARAFKNCGNLNSVIFSSSLVTIYAEAFAGDESLEAFLFDDTTGNPSSLRTIFTSAFDGCTSLLRFGEWDNALKYTLKLPAGVETVGSGAFYGTAFQYVQIGANVDEIGSRAFAQMYDMINITVDSGNTEYFTNGGALYDTRGYLLQYALNKTGTSFIVPETVNGVAIKYIDDEAFMGAMNLVSVNLGNVEQIRPRAFLNCSSLETVIGTNIKRVYARAFDGTPYAEENPNDFIVLGEVLYKYKGTDTVLNETDFPSGVTRIAPYAFAENEYLQTVYLPSTIEYIDDRAFSDCENLSVIRYLGENLPNVGRYVFEDLSVDFKFYFRKSLLDDLSSADGLYQYYYTDILSPVTTVAYFEDTNETVNFYYGEMIDITDSVVAGWYNQGWRRIDETTDEPYGEYLTEIVWLETVATVSYKADLVRVEDYTFEFYNGDVFIGSFPISLGDTYALTRGGYTLNGTTYTFANAAEMINCAYGDYYGPAVVDGVTIASFDAWWLDGEMLVSGTWDEYYHHPRPRFQANWAMSMFYALLNDGYGTTEYVEFNYYDGLLLPTPTREEYRFKGWMALDGTVYEGGELLNVTENLRLTAQWERFYNVTYANMVFMGQTAEVIWNQSFDESAPTYYEEGKGLDLTLASAFWQTGSPYSSQLVFLGWYTDMTFTTKVTSISETQTGDVTVYAKWRYDFDQSSRYGEYTITDADPYTEAYYDEIWLGLKNNNLYQELKNIGIKYVYIEIKLKIQEINDGYQEVLIYKETSPTSDPIWSVTDIQHYPGEVGSTAEYYIWHCTFNIDDIKDCNSLYVRYGAQGNDSDTWITEEAYMDIMYTTTTDSEENVKEFTWDYSAEVNDEDCTPLEDVSGL